MPPDVAAGGCVVDEGKLAAVLSDFARTMLTDFRIQGILDQLVRRIVEIVPVTGAGVTLIAPGLVPQYVAASDPSALLFERLQTELGEGPCLTAFTSGEAVLVPDLSSDLRYPAFVPAARSAGMAAAFTFPLRHVDGRLGALDLYRDRAGGLAPDDLSAAQTLADVAAAYLLNAQARRHASETMDVLRKSALHDQLTGLPNRIMFEERLEHASQRGQRTHSTSAVLFADLDRFKEVNDTHGHAIGDALLVAVARRLSGLIRPGDTLARLSGDEFVILCEDLAQVGDVELLVSRIGDAFAAPFVVEGADIPIGITVGVAYSGPGEAVTPRLVHAADTAMYEEKRRRPRRS